VRERAEHVRRGPARGDADDRIVATERELLQLRPRALRIVFARLARRAERGVAAGDQTDHASRLDLEGGRGLGGIQPPRRPEVPAPR
jgi:hypothetical protein